MNRPPPLRRLGTVCCNARESDIVPNMVSIVVLDPGQQPPADERYLVFEWRNTGGFSIAHESNGLRYRVGQEKHRFWSVEAPHLARRLGLDRIYYRGAPAGPPAAETNDAPRRSKG